MVLTAYFVLSPAIGFLVTVACAFRHRLDAGVEASGPHDFTVRVSAVRQKRSPRPPHPAPTFVTMANAPQRDGTAANMKVVWLKREQEYFSKRGWTRPLKNTLLICPSGQTTVTSRTITFGATRTSFEISAVAHSEAPWKTLRPRTSSVSCRETAMRRY
jgi:hypothetical protein